MIMVKFFSLLNIPPLRKWATGGQDILLLQTDKRRMETYKPLGTDGDN